MRIYKTNCKKIAHFKKSAEKEIHISETSFENNVTLPAFGKVTAYLSNQINKNHTFEEKAVFKESVKFADFQQSNRRSMQHVAKNH